MNKNQLVTRRELIDAIAVLHVINDNPAPSPSGSSESFSTILNKPRSSRGKRQGKACQSAYPVNLKGRFGGLDERAISSNTERGV
jgi:hypothetical protein